MNYLVGLNWPIVFFLLFGVCVVCGFNLDVDSPIVIQNSFDGPQSHFGVVVSLIGPTTTTTHDKSAKQKPNEEAAAGWIIIGSPKANSSHVNYTSIKEPGLLWRCSLGPAIACQPILLDPFGEANVRAKEDKVAINLVHHDWKAGSMLGSTMANKGRSFISCASRWMSQKYVGFHFMNGLCYWIDAEQLVGPAVARDDRADNNTLNWCAPDSTRMLPLVDKSRLSYALPNTEPPTKIFDWAFGQTGFSAHMTANNELLLGAPGVLDWTGSIIRYRNVSLARVKSHLIPKYMGPALPPSAPRTPPPFNQVVVVRAQNMKKWLQYFDYFGYSVTSGRFFRSNKESSSQSQRSKGRDEDEDNVEGGEMQYASGAPRAALLSGQVLVFTINEQLEGLNLLVEPIDGGYNGFGSYFGSVLAAGDMNCDGFDELLIGAPLYSSHSSSVSVPGAGSGGGAAVSFGTKLENGTADEGSKEPAGPIVGSTGDEGCVFVYFSNGDHFTDKPQELCGGHSPGARFGSAISILGDINDDSIADVAIGAPYESDGSGAVYIYHGSHTILVLAQKLSPLSISNTIKGFGLALSSGVDVDGNQFPDLAVGAYASNHVIVYRTIPVVNITGNLSAAIGKLQSSTGVFQIVSCLSFNGRNAPDSMRIWLKITVDIEVRKSRIVEFLTTTVAAPNGEASTTTTGTYKNYLVRLNTYRRDGGSCYTFQATTVGDLDLVTLPVTIRQEFWPETNEPGSHESPPSPHPIFIDIRKRSTPTNSISVTKRAGSPDWSDFARKRPLSMFGDSVGFSLASIPIAAICEEDGDPECLAHLRMAVRLENFDHDQYSLDEPFIIGSYKALMFKIELENARETATLPLTLDLSWMGPPYFKSSAGNDCRRNVVGGGVEGTVSTARGGKAEQSYTCAFKKPLTRNKKELLEIELDTTELYSDGVTSFMEFQLYANTSSELISPAELTVKFPVIGKTELLFYGQGSEAPYYDNMTAETVNFTHIYEVGIEGPSPVSSISLDFYIPETVLIDGVEQELLRIREPITTYDGNRLRCTSVGSPFYIETSTASSETDDDDVYWMSTSSSSQSRRRRRRRRDTKSPSSASTSASSSSSLGRTQLVLGCASFLASTFPRGEDSGRNFVITKCLHVQCEANYFHPGSRALIEFRLRLVTNTAKSLFVDEEREVVIVQSVGRVSLMNSTGARWGLALSSSPKGFIKVQRPSEVEAWILIVAMGGGLCLLTLLTVTLTRCGFFRRTKREELDALKAQHEVNEHFGFDFIPTYDDTEEYEDDRLSYHPPLPLRTTTQVGPGRGVVDDLEPEQDVDYADYAEIYDYRVYDGRTYC